MGRRMTGYFNFVRKKIDKKKTKKKKWITLCAMHQCLQIKIHKVLKPLKILS